MGLRGRKVINHSTSIKGPNGVRREEKRRERAGGGEGHYVLGGFTVEATTLHEQKVEGTLYREGRNTSLPW